MEITLYGVNPQRFQVSGETAPGSTRVETEKSQTPPGTPAAQGQGCNPPFCQNYYSRSTACRVLQPRQAFPGARRSQPVEPKTRPDQTQALDSCIARRKLAAFVPRSGSQRRAPRTEG